MTCPFPTSIEVTIHFQLPPPPVPRPVTWEQIEESFRRYWEESFRELYTYDECTGLRVVQGCIKILGPP